MAYSIEPAFTVANELARQLIKAGTDPVNQWFFSDGAFSADSLLERFPNTKLHENFVVISDGKIVSYMTCKWNRPLDIITSFRFIVFDKHKACTAARAIFQYLDYLFVIRGCNALNWIVAEQNYHAFRIYEKTIAHYFGHRVGKRHHGQKSYTGIISDVYLYEITREEYFCWKDKHPAETSIGA